MEAVLRRLPCEGLLFPKIGNTSNSARSAEFCRRCRTLRINGVSLHSYRYAWAERAKDCGYQKKTTERTRNGVALCAAKNQVFETNAADLFGLVESEVELHVRPASFVDEVQRSTDGSEIMSIFRIECPFSGPLVVSPGRCMSQQRCHAFVNGMNCAKSARA